MTKQLTKFPVVPGVQAEGRAYVGCQRVVGNTEVGPHVYQPVLGEVKVLVDGDRRVWLPEEDEFAAVVCP